MKHFEKIDHEIREQTAGPTIRINFHKRRGEVHRSKRSGVLHVELDAEGVEELMKAIDAWDQHQAAE